MFEYFPQSVATYWLNNSVVHANSIGATLGDIDDAARPYKSFYQDNQKLFSMAPKVSSDHGGAAQEVPEELVDLLKKGESIWLDNWLAVGRKLVTEGEKDLSKKHLFSAANKFKRAAALMTAVEWGMPKSAEKTATFTLIRDLVTRCLDLGGVKYEKLSLPYRDQTLDAWFFKASDSEEKCPTIIAYNGFHSSMDWYVQTGMTKHLTDRGVNVLVFDHPGTGTARHHKDIHMTPFTEKSAKVAVDYLESRSDVDAARIGVLGASFGGYYAVRAAAFEKRFAYAYCWGGWYYWPPEEIFKDGDPDAETSSSIEMANLEDLFWVTGTKTRHELYDAITSFHLEKVCPEVTTPLYIIHGEDDAQLTPWHAEEVIKRAVNAPYKELHIVREGEGGTQHCHIDNFDSPVHLLADKIADTL